ncbi:MAG TPA: hypothetical protein PKA88_07060 [Polyangiaceae bacterium]|nr:hypothetical protein [Polyangiaceae bacterium]HMR76882.1 hypothetical protein [Polyangiaceae bacterium]
MDPLREQDILEARRERPEVKLRQAIEMMELGLRLKRASLRERNPGASDAELQRLFEQWLLEND